MKKTLLVAMMLIGASAFARETQDRVASEYTKELLKSRQAEKKIQAKKTPAEFVVDDTIIMLKSENKNNR